jgi:hypothetical protein
LKLHTDHCVYGRMFCLQRETIHRRQWQSWKAHNNLEEMVMATVRIGENVQTMGREAVTAEVIASVIAIAMEEIVSSSERRRTCSWIRRW